MDNCSCFQRWKFTEVLLEDTEQPVEFYHISATKYYVIAAGKDNYLRVWSRQNQSLSLFRLSMPRKILAIGISSFPLRIYVSTEEHVRVFTVRPNAKGTCILSGTKNVEKIRFQQGLLILCSKISVTGFRFQEETKAWNPEFLISILKGGHTGNILDAILVHETKLLILSKKKEVLGWRIYDHEELVNQSLNNEPERPFGNRIANNTIIFQPRYHWTDRDVGDVLDISSEGLCLIQGHESFVYVLDFLKESDKPVSGWVGNGLENNYGGYGYFLRSCGIDVHQAPFIFCGSKYLEWVVSQKHPNRTKKLGDNHFVEKYATISLWQSDKLCDDGPVFPFCYHYSSGLAFVWNSQESEGSEGSKELLVPTVSAVLLLDYTEQPGNCRFYEHSDYIDGYYNDGKESIGEEEDNDSEEVPMKKRRVSF